MHQAEEPEGTLLGRRGHRREGRRRVDSYKLGGMSSDVPNTYIVNHCSGGYIYKLTNHQYTNPFMWSLIDYESMANLVTRLPNIDFRKIKLISDFWSEPVIEIDGCVRVIYPHIKLDWRAKSPRIDGGDVFTDKPGIYAVDKYVVRVKRMLAAKYQPVFIISEDADYRPAAMSIDKVLLFSEIVKRKGTCFPCYVFTNTKDVKDLVECKYIKYVFTQYGLACPFAQYLISNRFIDL